MYQLLFHKDRESTLDMPSRGGFFFFFALKKLLIFNWRIIVLQCCAGFCHTSTLEEDLTARNLLQNCGGGLKKHKKENSYPETRKLPLVLT